MPAIAQISSPGGNLEPHGLNLAMEKLARESRDPAYDELDTTIIGQSAAMAEVKQHILSLGKSDLTVLIGGDSGTGKDLVARAIHGFSPRENRPFIKVNTPGLPSTLFESELFGFEQGAFTGASRKKPGKFQLAHTGTIFLDEISEVPLPMQAKLLQVLEDREFSSLGSTNNTQIDVRVVAATNANLNEMVSQGLFRLDLYYRLNVACIHIPPLRERKEDIDLLCDHFLQKYAARYGRNCTPLPQRIRQRFYDYSWPGNVRELENAIQRIIAVGDAEFVSSTTSRLEKNRPLRAVSNAGAVSEDKSELPKQYTLKEVGKKAVRKAERHAILDALNYTGWNRKKAAALLKTSYRTLLSRIKEYGIAQA
jgi:transcriptional regulator with PAS, ATPase and Fis domain